MTMAAAAKRDAVVFLAHYFDAEVERRFLKLRREVSSRCDVFLLVEKGTGVPEGLGPFAHAFDFEVLKTRARSVIGERIVPGNCHLRSLDFFERFPDYRYYWFIEYDVVYTGDWGAFIDNFANDDADLLATHVRRLADNPGWYWTKTFIQSVDALPREQWVLAFLPIYRISARALKAVAHAVRNGWTGHFEALLPTAVARAGLRVSDLGGNSAWTPANRRDRHYLTWSRPEFLGTVRHHPPIRRMLIRNMLHHPCKTPLSEEVPVLSGAKKARRKAFMAYALKIAQLTILSRLGDRRGGC